MTAATLTQKANAKKDNAKQLDAARASKERAPLVAPILVATDASNASDMAVRAAMRIGRALEVPVQILSVVEPVGMLVPSGEYSGIPTSLDLAQSDERLARVREQRRRVGADAESSIEIKFGARSATIARIAKERQARLIVMGFTAHGPVDRVMGSDTVFDVVRLATTPVMVVVDKFETVPQRIAVATDFSDLSMNAARTALELFPGAGLMDLVHVTPVYEAGMAALWAGHEAGYKAEVKKGFDRMRSGLPVDVSLELKTVELSGKTERKLADFALKTRCDLLVVGSYRRGLFRRLAGGHLGLRLLRVTPCSVLVVPESASAVTIGKLEPVPNLADEAIAARLRDITRRNAGRRVVVEVDNPKHGAQALAFDYSFLAADFDTAHGRTHVIVADGRNGEEHRVTHSVGRPLALDIRRAVDGSDYVVRLRDAIGQLVITFW